MIRLGKFTQAIQAGDERRSSLRKENAALYSDFIGQNPGASMDDRTDFANNLIQETGVGSRGLPTRSAMQGSVDKYQKEQAVAAAGRARAAERNRLQAVRQGMIDVENALNFASTNGSTPEATQSLLESLGADVSDMSIYTARLEELGFRKWEQNNSQQIQAYFSNPTKAGFDQLNATGADFGEMIETRYSSPYLAAEGAQSKVLNSALRDLTGQDLTPTEFKNRRLTLLENVSQSVREGAASVIEGTQEEFEAAHLAREVLNRSEGQSSLQRMAIDPNATQEQIALQINQDISAANLVGIDLGQNYGDEAMANFDVEQAKRDSAQEAQITATVGDQTETAIDAARGDKSLDAVVAKLETDLSAAQGEEVQLNQEQIALLKGQLDDASTQLQRDMEAVAKGRVDDVNQYASAAAQTKAEFVSSFVTQMQASGNGAINNAEARFGELAEQTYDNIISATREQMNQEEGAKIYTAVSEMNTARSTTFNIDEAGEIYEGLLLTPDMLGDAEGDDEVKVASTRIRADLLNKATTIAQSLDIPMTEALYRQMVQELANSGEAYVPGDTFDTALVRSALMFAARETLEFGANGVLERFAFNEAITISGIENFAAITPQQEFAFRNAYQTSRRDMATEAYDVISPSFAEDISRSTPLVAAATRTITDSSTKVAAANASLNAILSLSGGDFLSADATAVELVVKDAFALIPDLDAKITDINTELSRLNRLSNTSIYTTSEHAQALRDRITQLTEARDTSVSGREQIRVTVERAKALEEKDISEQELFAAQTELDEWKMIGGDTMFDPDPTKRVSTRSLSPQALELLRMELEQRRNPPPASNLPY
jgi:hypothetical protein